MTAASQPSTLAVADLDESGQATYTFYADNAADLQWTDEELAATRQDEAACLHTGSLALIRQPGGRRIEDHLARAREHVTVSTDPTVRPLLVPPSDSRERLPRRCVLADIIRPREDDLRFGGVAELPAGSQPVLGRAPVRVCDRLRCRTWRPGLALRWEQAPHDQHECKNADSYQPR